MKWKLLVLLFCLFSPFAQAETLTAVPFAEVLSRFQATEFHYGGRGLAFGFSSIQSCIWQSRDFLVLEHYCYPKRNYPARALELWSKEFGIVQIYEEVLEDGIVKRDIRLNEFPERAAKSFPADFRVLDMEGVVQISEKLYQRFNPACWSTNFDQNSRAAEAGCYQTDIGLFPEWGSETQAIVNSPDSWTELWRQLNGKIPGQSGT